MKVKNFHFIMKRIIIHEGHAMYTLIQIQRQRDRLTHIIFIKMLP